MVHKHNAKLLDGRKRQAIITALANGESKRSIARRLSASNHTVDAVAEAEWQQVAARKERIAAQAELNATLAAQVLTDALEAGKVPVNLAVLIYGVSIDKAVLLRGDAQVIVEHHHAHVHVDAMEDFNARYKLLPKRAETPSLRPAQSISEMDSQSQTENSKNG